jgi:hypothetical protein
MCFAVLIADWRKRGEALANCKAIAISEVDDDDSADPEWQSGYNAAARFIAGRIDAALTPQQPPPAT